MLTVLRRHTQECCIAHGIKPWTRSFPLNRCRCPLHVEGTLRIEGFIRRGLGTSDKDQANKIKRQWEDAGTSQVPNPSKKPGAILVKDAVTSMLSDLAARNLAWPTRRRYKYLLLDRFVPFLETQGLCYLSQVDLATLDQFRQSWKTSPLTSTVELVRLRSFYRYAIDRKWIDENLAKKLKRPEYIPQQKEPFSHEEYARIIHATYHYPLGIDNNPVLAKELRAFVLVLRHTGLRITDAARLRKDALSRSQQGLWGLNVWQQKVRRWVFIPIPDGRHGTENVVAALQDQVTVHPGPLFFRDSLGETRYAANSLRDRLTRLFAIAKVKKAYPHRFRHTFAAELLLAGIDIKLVSIYLGHSSVATTEKYYARFNVARQTQLEEAMEAAWQRQAEKRKPQLIKA